MKWQILFFNNKVKKQNKKRDFRITFEEFRTKALANPEVKKEYENLKPIFEIKKQLIQAR